MVTIEKRLGSGAFGDVYLISLRNQDQYALKVTWLRNNGTGKSDPLGEAKLLERLCHPHLTQCCGHFLENNILYLLMEYCEHGSMKIHIQRQIQKECYFDESVVVKWTSQMSNALRYLHDKKIIHRDLKTENVFLCSRENVKVGDLGIARELEFTNEEANSFVGTLPYMSPELLDGQPYNSKSDMWSLGCCVHEIMTLTQTFPSRFLELAEKMRQGEIPPFPLVYSKRLEDVVLRLLQHDPEQRPDALEVLYYLHKITKKRFEQAPHSPIAKVDVTKVKTQIIDLISNYILTTDEEKDDDKTDHQSTTRNTRNENITIQQRRTVKGSSQDLTLVPREQETLDPDHLAQEAGKWLQAHSASRFPQVNQTKSQPKTPSESHEAVTLYSRAMSVRFQRTEPKEQISRSSQLPKEMMDAALDVIKLYQFEDKSVMEMMLVCVLGQKNFNEHGPALLKNHLDKKF